MRKYISSAARYIKKGGNQLKKILARSILYFTLAVVISIAIIGQGTDAFGVKMLFAMSILFVYPFYIYYSFL